MRSTANRGLAIIGGAVIIIGIVVAALASTWSAPERDPNSPEGVVQTYLAAVFAHDANAAFATLEQGTACTVTNFDQSYVDQSSRAVLVDAKTQGDGSDVHVRIEHSNGDPFGGTWTEEQYFRLVRQDGHWRISGQPWPLYCGVVVK